MSGLAWVLAKKGYSVSGSDTVENASIRKLRTININIFKEQKTKHITQITNSHKNEVVIVISSAISEKNKELQEAHKQKLRIFHRSEILSYLISNKKSILIAGSHGKTTTSTLISTILANNNYDPTSIIGGIVPLYKSNAYAGNGDLLIAEIDESDGSITRYAGDIALLTNIELDHTDYYKDLNSLMESINLFANNSKVVVANYDCPNLRKYLSRKSIWYSTKTFDEVKFAGIPIEMNGMGTTANYFEKGKLIDQIKISLSGLHNFQNTISAIAACRSSGISFLEIKNSLSNLESPQRRFEFKGTWNNRNLIDDYAHHPTEVRESISMARLLINSKQSFLPIKAERLIIIFQPHRYSRLRDLMKDFANNLSKADLIILAPIYSAGETPIKGVNNEILKSFILERNPSLCIINCNNINDIKNKIKEKTQAHDLIVIMGAGDIVQLSKELINDPNKNKQLESKIHVN